MYINYNCINKNKDWQSIGTANYDIGKFWNKLKKLLTDKECDILNTEALIRKLTKETIPA